MSSLKMRFFLKKVISKVTFPSAVPLGYNHVYLYMSQTFFSIMRGKQSQVTEGA